MQSIFGAVDELTVMALEGDFEKLLQDVVRLAAAGGGFGVEPSLAAEIRAVATSAAARLATMAPAAVIVTRPELREITARLVSAVRPRIWVLSYQEIPADKRIKVVELLGRPVSRHAQS